MPIGSRYCFAVLLLLGACALAGPARAQTLAFTLVSGVPTLAGGPQTDGFSFTVSKAIAVTDLGVYDAGGDGLGAAHLVGIFNASRQLLVSATVPAGVGDLLVNQFRFTAISPIVLQPGQYAIAAYYVDSDPDRVLVRATGLTSHSPIKYGSGLAISGGGFQYPLYPTGVAGSDFGPNFRFVTVPEPSTFALVMTSVMSGAGLLLRGRRRA